MDISVLLFVSIASAMLGQFMDTRTTEVALGKGFIEANALMARIIKKVGITPVYAFKVAALPLGIALLSLQSVTASIVLGFAAAGLGFVFGTLNYLKLRKAKIAVF